FDGVFGDDQVAQSLVEYRRAQLSRVAEIIFERSVELIRLLRLEIRRGAGAGQGKLLLRRPIVHRQALLRKVEAERREGVQLIKLRAIDCARRGKPQEQIVLEEKTQVQARQDVRVMVLWTDRVVVDLCRKEGQRRPQRGAGLNWIEFFGSGVVCANLHLFVDGGIGAPGRHLQRSHL